MSKVSEKTKTNAIVAAHEAQKYVEGLAKTFKANGLDDKPVAKAAKALGESAEVAALRAKLEAAAKKKQAYRDSLSPAASELDALRAENEKLKAQLSK